MLITKHYGWTTRQNALTVALCTQDSGLTQLLRGCRRSVG